MEELHGELTESQRAELRNLMIEFKKINEGHPPTMKAADIKMLDKEKNARLWKYIEHVSRIVVLSTIKGHNHMGTIRKIAKNMQLYVPDLVEEAVQEAIIWCYVYAWRNFNPDIPKPEGIIYQDAEWGFRKWYQQYANENKMSLLTGETLKDLDDHESDSTGGKVTNMNI